MRQGSFVSPATLKAVAELLSNMAETAVPAGCGCREFEPEFIHPRFAEPCGCEMPPRWGVCKCEPREDRNKVFGINIRVDEPKRSDFCSQWAFERARAKFDHLVDAAEAVDWENKSNFAPLHRVNCIRRPMDCPPPVGVNLVGESVFFPEW